MTQRILTMMVSAVLMMVVVVQPASAALLPDAPTLVHPKRSSAVDSGSPVITGLAPAGMRVAVYIDDTFNGYATTVSTKGGVQSFKYTPFLPLTVGEHTVMTRTEDVAQNVRSRKSRVTRFTVEPPYPAPTLLAPVVNEETNWQQPWIVGVAHSGATVKVWIDGTLNGSAVASADTSGTGDFRYQPFLALKNGSHTVTAVASVVRPDGTVRNSTQSEERVLRVAPPVVAQTVEEDVDAAAPTNTADEAVQGTSPVPSANTNVGETIAPAPENSTPVNDESTADSDSDNDSSGKTRTVVGWILLIIAAAVIVAQMRQRRPAPTSGEMQFGPSKSTDSGAAAPPAQPTSPTASQQQLELHAPKENKNVQLVEKKEPPTTPS